MNNSSSEHLTEIMNTKKSKSQLRKEVKAMSEELMMPQNNLQAASFKELKSKAAMLEHFLKVEKGVGPTIAQRLIENGIQLPNPESLDDDQVTKKLWEVIYGMADLCHLINHTCHLSDRELYEYLWSDLLNKASSTMGPDLGILAELHQVADFDSIAYFKYYEDEIDIEYFQCIHPDEPLPKQEPLPYPREGRLPK